MAMSADGSEIASASYSGEDDEGPGDVIYLGAQIYTSPDSGSTWTMAATGTAPTWAGGVVLSPDGSRLTAAGGYQPGAPAYGLYSSPDLGASWQLFSVLPTNFQNNSQLVIGGGPLCSSSAGTTLVVGTTYFPLDAPLGGGGRYREYYLYLSTNSGASWTAGPEGLWTALASSASGDKIVAVSSGYIYRTIFPTGALQVTLGPAGAVSAGAKWQVDDGAWQGSGATVSDLLAGSHTLAFSQVAGWVTPTNQTVIVSANSTKEAAGTYAVQTGSLTVNISPAAAVDAGAMWQVDSQPFQSSGATVSGLSLGNHKVSFNTISGWTTPASQTVSVSANSVASATGTYVEQFGSLYVSISPAAAIADGAQWQVDGGAWQNSGATVSSLTVGNHLLSFNMVGGWTTPSNQTVLIKSNAVAKATGTYVYVAQGIYNGLFAQANTNVASSGMLSGVAVTASGSYSGKLLIGNSTNSISGAFNSSGQATNNVPRANAQGGPLTLAMTLNWNVSPPMITGTVSGTNGGPWTANLTAELASTATNSADYTAWVLPSGTPPGYGYLLITNHAGAVTLSGALADGTAFSQTVPLSGNGDLPVYGNLSGGTELLLGWLGLESGSPAGSLAWIKESLRSSALYTNGFTNLVVVQGSPWTNPPPNTAAMNLPFGQLDISGGGLVSDLIFNVAMSNNNTLVKLTGSPANSLTGTNNPKTGLLTITFGNGKTTTTGTGAALQNATNAAGFFLGKTNAGSFLLQP